MSAAIQECFFVDRESLFGALKTHLEHSLTSALEQRERASLAVSGGSTPAPLYQALTDSPIDWPRVDLTLTDERFVAANHADSNEAMLRRTLLSGSASAARFFPLTQSCENAEQAARKSSADLAQISQPLDAIILGMGNDMHTASLFPDAPELAKALDLQQEQTCVVLHPPSSPHARLSLSLRALLNCREIILLITGHDKKTTLQQALDASCIEDAPVAAFLQQNNVPIHIYWSP